MARGRMVSTTVATDISLNGMSLEAEYLFLKTVPHLDRDGLILADAPILWGRVCPRRPQFLARIDELVSEWIAAGLVLAYPTADGRALFFPGFAKNQNFQYNREGKSSIPPPPGYVRTATGLVLEPPQPPETGPKSNAELVQSNSRVTLEELTVKLREEKGREGEETVLEPPPSAALIEWGRTHPIDSITERDHESLCEVISLYGDDDVARAIRYCHEHKTTKFVNFSYLQKTLLGWQTDGKLGASNGPAKPRAPAGPERSVVDGVVYERDGAGKLVSLGRMH